MEFLLGRGFTRLIQLYYLLIAFIRGLLTWTYGLTSLPVERIRLWLWITLSMYFLLTFTCVLSPFVCTFRCAYPVLQSILNLEVSPDQDYLLWNT